MPSTDTGSSKNSVHVNVEHNANTEMSHDSDNAFLNEVNAKNWQTNSSSSNASYYLQNSYNDSNLKKQNNLNNNNNNASIFSSEKKLIKTFNFTSQLNELSRRPANNETIFKISKGVKTFDFSFEQNLLITGGNFKQF